MNMAPETKTTNWGATISAIVGVIAGVATILGTLVYLNVIRIPGVNSTSTSPSVTNTPTATALPANVYGTHLPGPDCDTGTGHWFTSGTAGASDAITITCASAGLQMTKFQNAPFIGEVFFDWPSHTFANNYSVQSQIQLGQTTCAGALVLAEQFRSYSGLICSDQVWKIIQYDDVGSPTILKRGTMSSLKTTDPITLKIDVTDTAVSLTVNSQTLGSVTRDAEYTTTAQVGLVVDGEPTTSQATATFSNFLYIPAA